MNGLNNNYVGSILEQAATQALQKHYSLNPHYVWQGGADITSTDGELAAECLNWDKSSYVNNSRLESLLNNLQNRRRLLIFISHEVFSQAQLEALASLKIHVIVLHRKLKKLTPKIVKYIMLLLKREGVIDKYCSPSSSGSASILSRPFDSCSICNLTSTSCSRCPFDMDFFVFHDCPRIGETVFADATHLPIIFYYRFFFENLSKFAASPCLFEKFLSFMKRLAGEGVSGESQPSWEWHRNWGTS